MLARLRNSTIALLGTVTVVGLSLVVFISQLGFPGVFNGSIPDGPSRSIAVHDAIALTQGTRVGHQRFRGQPVSARARSSLPDSSRPAVKADLDSSSQVGHRSVEHPPSVTANPPSTPTPEPVGEPEIPPPAPTTETSDPETDSSAHSQKAPAAKSSPKAEGHSQNTAKGQVEVKPDVPSSGESQNHHSGKAKQHSGPPPKPTSHSSGKPNSTRSSPGKSGKSGKSGTSTSKPSSAPPPPEPAEKRPPEAGGKETRDAGRSDKSHH
jgi:hypothetical protein